ncbi:MAG TPA: hypothetical protein VMU38_04455 [Candidatus Binatia bacterium]|nr:hypothetical protein [Candidatus Binatia bacterium]
MARRAAAAIAAFALAAVAGIASAQTLARLTVESFVLAADTNAPQVDVPFHLILTLRVRERVTSVENLNLPVLAELELLGDERETTSGSRGTEYRETIAVVAHRAGAIAIGPATLEAVDARDGKAKEWSTNGLTLHVAGAAPQTLKDGASAIEAGAIVFARTLLVGFGIVAVVVAAVLLLGRRPRPAPIVVPPPVTVEAPVRRRSPQEQAGDALVVLRAERSRPSAVAVRAAMWRMVGAGEGETLGDVLGRRDIREGTLRELLIALERSAFTYDDDLPAAIEDACGALERFIGSAG